MQLHNVQALKPHRKELRSTMTPAEIRLWQALKHRQLDGLKFRRQPSIGPFIADFYCPAAKLVIELDGSVHDSEIAQQQDAERTAYLVSLGLRVVRLANREVMENLAGVLSEIRRRARA
ncbi:MAG: endonuclease domain-containing protein [Candidatus Competibacteraceae bacterium]|nr:MAG: endonuclease domain-containing protein [Candidatus Competibacteraceae bacterium]